MERDTCRSCGAENVPLRSDGTVDTHQSIGYNPIGPTDGRCHGSGRPPAGAAG